MCMVMSKTWVKYVPSTEPSTSLLLSPWQQSIDYLCRAFPSLSLSLDVVVERLFDVRVRIGEHLLDGFAVEHRHR